ncbi:ABC transporter permease [Pseudoduganella plicata]|uniref:Transport permease protein n=1 Tax=Pseudoduganella plicata TaxID=321984 RepID=A0A4P7BEI7_9BURK|nr:ABC transporter permease [Pseudoduganella plicata]QBQ36670.1 ABC transporter permease [Pseudoduganella plicata]GGY73631.1 transport permease protein [Pseudoduganella plicata]
MAGALLRAIWNYRGFIFGSVRREFQSKYRNTMLGASWAVLSPLALVLVYTLIFSQVMHSRLPGATSPYAYSIYLCAGVLTWGLFAEITTRGQVMFLENGNLLKKISFPRISLPIIVVANALVNFAIVFSLFIAFLLITGQFVGLPFLGLVPVLAIQILLSIGLALVLGILNVFFRDVGQFFNIAIQFWFWLTPVVYPFSIIPATLQPWLLWNPMTPLIQSYQRVLVDGQWPHWPQLAWPLVLALLLCVLGLKLFRKRANEMVDEL